jgi:hypothetical protein
MSNRQQNTQFQTEDTRFRVSIKMEFNANITKNMSLGSIETMIEPWNDTIILTLNTSFISPFIVFFISLFIICPRIGDEELGIYIKANCEK